MDYKMKRAASAKLGKKFAAALSAAVLVAPTVAQAAQPVVALAEGAELDVQAAKEASVETYLGSAASTQSTTYAMKYNATKHAWYTESYADPTKDAAIFSKWQIRKEDGTVGDNLYFVQDNSDGGDGFWYLSKDADGTTLVDLAGLADGSVQKLTATWVDAVDITYDMNGGTSDATSEQIKVEGATGMLKAKPTLTGYTLAGWTVDGVDANGAAVSKEMTAGVQGNETDAAAVVRFVANGDYDATKGVTMTAIWARNTYTIEYGLNGGDPDDDQWATQEIKFIDTAGADYYQSTKLTTRGGTVDPTKRATWFIVGTGYKKGTATITNWACPQTGDAIALGALFANYELEDLEAMSTDGTIKLVAMYGEDQNATLDFNARTDGVNAQNPERIEGVKLNSTAAQLGALDEITTKVPGNLGARNIDSDTTDPTYKKFVGWKDPAGNVYKNGTALTNAQKLTLLNQMQAADAGITLDAVWEDTYLVQVLPGDDTLKNAYAKNYYLNFNGQLLEAANTDVQPNDFRIAESDKTKLPTNDKDDTAAGVTFSKITRYSPALANATFAGWASVDGKTVFGVGTKLTADAFALADKNGLVQLFGSWNPLGAKFVVNYDANGGKGATMASSTFKVGDGQKLSKNTYMKDNHEFLGWTILKQGTGTVFEDQASHEGVIETTALRSGNQTATLYAQWGKKYTVKFDAGDTKDTVKATGSTADQAAVETKAAELNDCGFVKDGYTFAGWEYDGKVVSTTADLDSYATAGGSVTVKATWVHTSSPEVKVTKEALQKSVDEAAKVKPEEYTEESAKAFEDALKAAKDVLADEKATQAQVDAANLDLKVAQAALVKKPVEPEPLADGWHQEGGSDWQYIKNGEPVKGAWVADGGEWYYMNANGFMVDGWMQDADGNWYYMNQSHDGTFGAMVTGWVMSDGNWYYMNPNAGGPKGAMMTGWQWVNGKCYYLYEQTGGPKGACAISTTTPDGYRVDENGAWIQ